MISRFQGEGKAATVPSKSWELPVVILRLELPRFKKGGGGLLTSSIVIFLVALLFRDNDAVPPPNKPSKSGAFNISCNLRLEPLLCRKCDAAPVMELSVNLRFELFSRKRGGIPIGYRGYGKDKIETINSRVQKGALE